MSTAPESLLVDCSVVVKWRLTSEPHALQARELLQDWHHDAIKVCAPDQLFAELANALLGACREPSPSLSATEALDAVQEIRSLPFTIYKTTGKRILVRAFEIACQYNQRAYDCIYVALAERKGIEFWTDDQRLCNTLQSAFPFIRRIADYQRKRP